MKDEQTPQPPADDSSKWSLKGEIKKRGTQELQRNLETKRRTQAIQATQPTQATSTPAETPPAAPPDRVDRIAARPAVRSAAADSGSSARRWTIAIAGGVCLILVVAGIALLAGRLRSSGENAAAVVESPVRTTPTPDSTSVPPSGATSGAVAKVVPPQRTFI